MRELADQVPGGWAAELLSGTDSRVDHEFIDLGAGDSGSVARREQSTLLDPLEQLGSIKQGVDESLDAHDLFQCGACHVHLMSIGPDGSSTTSSLRPEGTGRRRRVRSAAVPAG